MALHTPVLLHEVIGGLDIRPNDTVVDATVGSGGHAKVILAAHSSIRFVGLDRDRDSIDRTREALGALADDGKVRLIESNFRDIEAVVKAAGHDGADKILFDLGWSSDQFELSGRGFSFQKDEPLQMTYEKGQKATVTARTIVNEWSEETLADILWGFGEERYSRKIAKAIVEAREASPIETTGELVAIIESATPASYHHRKIHFATKTFQALRIAANDEYNTLRQGLEGAWAILRPGGRIAVISFHSGEDRIVKHFFKDREGEGAKRITKKPIVASPEEQGENRRARSAKLRIIQK